MRNIAIAFCGLALLSACTPGTGGGPDRLPDNPYAPGITDRKAGSVDGLLVGHRLMEAGQYELALKSYLRAASHEGATPEVLSALGSANLQLGRLGQAETLLRRAIKDDPQYAAAWNNLGVVLMERGETGEAKEVFRRAFALDSGRSDSIRENLRLAIAKTEITGYDAGNEAEFGLEAVDGSAYKLLLLP
ncbi:MAG: tetratricopeptide repeat protein [Brevirhabdus sp.]